MKLKNRLAYKQRRHIRLRQKVRGTALRPRMSVCITNRHIYIQFIDDEAGTTLASFSTLNLKQENNKLNVAAAGETGREAAQAALSKGIKEVVLDRGGLAYAGRIRAIAEAARKAGIKL